MKCNVKLPYRSDDGYSSYSILYWVRSQQLTISLEDVDSLHDAIVVLFCYQVTFIDGKCEGYGFRWKPYDT